MIVYSTSFFTQRVYFKIQFHVSTKKHHAVIPKVLAIGNSLPYEQFAHGWLLYLRWIYHIHRPLQLQLEVVDQITIVIPSRRAP